MAKKITDGVRVRTVTLKKKPVLARAVDMVAHDEAPEMLSPDMTVGEALERNEQPARVRGSLDVHTPNQGSGARLSSHATPRTITLRKKEERADEEETMPSSQPSVAAGPVVHHREELTDEQEDTEIRLHTEEKTDETEEEDAGIILTDEDRVIGMHTGVIMTPTEDEDTLLDDAVLNGAIQTRVERRRTVRWGVLSGAAVVVGALVIVSTVFSRATLVLKPHAEQITIQGLAVAFDSSISEPVFTKKMLPAEVLTLSKTARKTFPATGSEFIKEKASGTIKIYNRFSSSPQPLVARTRFLTESGVLFRILKSVTVPGAEVDAGQIVPQFIEVEAVADEAGSAGNMRAGTEMNIPGFKGSSKYEGFYAVVVDDITGGFEGEAVVISAEDHKNATEAVTKTVYEQIDTELLEKMPSAFTFVDTLRSIEIEEVIIPEVGTRMDRFDVEARASGRNFVFRTEDVIALLQQSLFDDGLSVVIPESLNLVYEVRATNFEGGRADVTLSGDVTAKRVVTKSEIAQALAGKKEGTVLKELRAREEVANFAFTLFPPWMLKTPSDPEKIKFIIEEP